MRQHHYVVSEYTVYRRIRGELVVVLPETGMFYYYNLATEDVLRFYARSHTLAEYIEAAGLAGDDAQRAARTLEQMVEQQILKEAASAAAPAPKTEPNPRTTVPLLLREGEHKIEDYACLPIVGRSDTPNLDDEVL
jgi:hypothetical protein